MGIEKNRIARVWLCGTPLSNSPLVQYKSENLTAKNFPRTNFSVC